MLYRDHAGSLADSMKTVIEVSSLNDIENHINETFSELGIKVDKIKLRYVGFDSRVAWDTYYVLVKLNSENGFKVLGMTNGILN